MTVSVRLNKNDEKLIRAYAEMNNISLSDLLRNKEMEWHDDDWDEGSWND